VNNDESFIKWTDRIKNALKYNKQIYFLPFEIRNSLYRPFNKNFLYFDHLLNQRRYQQHIILPKPENEKENRIICVCGIGHNKPFHTIIANAIPCFDLLEKTQCFPFYTYDEDNGNRRENITDWVLEQFRRHYEDTAITKWDIFYYIYGLLHHPEYRYKYANNLRRELPRILFTDDFRAFDIAGEKLANLHINYEQQREYPLREIENTDLPLDWRVEKMKLSRDKTAVVYNDFLTLAEVPPETFEYRLGNRSALEWIIDQYRVKTDKRSGIVSDPNNESDRWYIRRLIKKIVTVSIETVQIVNNLPNFEII